MAQIFARLAVQDFQALALAGAVQHMDQTGGLDGLALLVHENARVVLLAGRLLDARQQLHHIPGAAAGVASAARAGSWAARNAANSVAANQAAR